MLALDASGAGRARRAVGREGGRACAWQGRGGRSRRASMRRGICPAQQLPAPVSNSQPFRRLRPCRAPLCLGRRGVALSSACRRSSMRGAQRAKVWLTGSSGRRGIWIREPLDRRPTGKALWADFLHDLVCPRLAVPLQVGRRHSRANLVPSPGMVPTSPKSCHISPSSAEMRWRFRLGRHWPTLVGNHLYARASWGLCGHVARFLPHRGAERDRFRSAS